MKIRVISNTDEMALRLSKCTYYQKHLFARCIRIKIKKELPHHLFHFYRMYMAPFTGLENEQLKMINILKIHRIENFVVIPKTYGLVLTFFITSYIMVCNVLQNASKPRQFSQWFTKAGIIQVNEHVLSIYFVQGTVSDKNKIGSLPHTILQCNISGSVILGPSASESPGECFITAYFLPPFIDSRIQNFVV